MIKHIERWIWYLFLVTFAWQTRIILWQADRAFIEWRSISLYASDVLLFLLFAIAAVAIAKKIQFRDPINISLIGFLLIALVSLRNTDQLVVSWYAWARLLQGVLLFWYVRYHARYFSLDAGLAAFVIGALVQSWLAIGQYLLQHDVGIRWLGETLLNTGMRGVAVFYDLSGEKILRAYGTLPHPNVLAAYLLAALWALVYLYQRHKHWIFGIAGTIMLWAFYLTFSRTIIALGLTAAAVAVIVGVRERKKILIWWLIATTIFGMYCWQQVAARATISSQEEAVQLRVYYAREAISSGGDRWLNVNWTGIGIGNFVSWLHHADPNQPSWVYQPAHNLYLLVYSEMGVLGIILFAAAIVFAIRCRSRIILILFVSFLAMALFDHFFWTLQQGRVLFWLISGILTIYIKSDIMSSTLE